MAGYPAIEAFPDHGAVPTRRPGRKPCSATQGAPSHARGGMAQAVPPETSETRSAHGAKASGIEARWGETPPATSCPARKRRPARPRAPAPTLHISEPIWGTSTLPAQCPRAPDARRTIPWPARRPDSLPRAVKASPLRPWADTSPRPAPVAPGTASRSRRCRWQGVRRHSQIPQITH